MTSGGTTHLHAQAALRSRLLTHLAGAWAVPTAAYVPAESHKVQARNPYGSTNRTVDRQVTRRPRNPRVEKCPSVLPQRGVHLPAHVIVKHAFANGVRRARRAANETHQKH
eukprot:7188011-Pyramimonas_sp.AAC.1